MASYLKKLIRILHLIALASVLIVFPSCEGGGSDQKREVRFAVISDPHVYNTALGVSGDEFEDYAQCDVKMILESELIFREALLAIRKEPSRPSFLIIPGDLTKDGEYESHVLTASHLSVLQRQGIAVYVVPGNHDVRNPEAFGYGQNGKVPAEGLDEEGFEAIYRDFGYGSALFRDPDSLSYVVEPFPGLWLFAINTCRYKENNDKAVTSGRIGASTLDWAISLLDKASSLGKTCIGMMHHGPLEHFTGHGEVFPDYILENWEEVGRMLAKAGMLVVFTGHYHTQNITGRRWEEGERLIEIQTGSSSIYPVPYRIISMDMKEKRLAVETRYLLDVELASYPTGFLSFEEYARDFKEGHTRLYIERQLSELFSLAPDNSEDITGLAVRAVMHHQEGDEIPTWNDFISALRLSESRDHGLRRIGLFLLSLWHDLPPGDNFFISGAGFSF